MSHATCNLMKENFSYSLQKYAKSKSYQTWAEIDIKLSNGNLPPPSTSFLKKSSKAPLHIYLIKK